VLHETVSIYIIDLCKCNRMLRYRIDVFQESITIASACNKVMRKRFLKPDTIGLIPKGGYTSNIKQSIRKP
jgi:hypothetical protein